MLNNDEFRKYAHMMVDWMAGYLRDVENYPVKSKVKPGEIYNQLPDRPPEEGESIEKIFEDFKNVILPGVTHWQSPNFFAYFPANSSYPSLLAEMLTTTMGAVCMKWETSPSAAELEEKMMNWLIQMLGLPESFQGVIQDSASSATLCAILSAREKYTDYKINEKGFQSFNNLTVYCSSETHSSIEKAVKIVGLGKQNLIKVEVDSEFRMDPDKLRQKISIDIKNGGKPICVVATLGTTGSTAIDPLDEIADICAEKGIWLHVDAAFAGSALLLPEYRWMIKGVEKADSFVFNPHKWLFTNFDCSAYFIKDASALLRTLEILPEYLKTKTEGKVNDYCDWGIPLGRRFRALKLWFVFRNYGIRGLQEKLRAHIDFARFFTKKVEEDENFEVLVPPRLSLVCFRFKPRRLSSTEEINSLNERLHHEINKTGKIYITHTKLKGVYTLRMAIGQTYVEKKHVVQAWDIIKKLSRELESSI